MLLIYDGDCGFCTSSARWIEARLPPEVEVRPFQTLDLDEVGLTETEVASAAWFIDDDGRRHRGHQAIGRSLVAAGGAWGVVGRVITVPPVSWLARPVYRLVSHQRHRLPGSTDACDIDD